MYIQNSMKNRKNKLHLSIFEMVLFAMLGALMLCSKLVMEFLPNIHLLGMFTMVFTLVFRKKALIPIYVYVFLNGLLAGFSMWWVPFLYIWTVLWGITMLLPRNMSKKTSAVVYPLVCGLHGLFYGILYAPCQALFFGFDFKQTLIWIMTGIPWDVLHFVGNFAAGLLIVPLAELLRKICRKRIEII